MQPGIWLWRNLINRKQINAQHLDVITLDTEYEAAAFKEVLAFMISAGKPGRVGPLPELAANPKDLRHDWDWPCLASEGKYPEALEEFLAIVAKDKHFRDEVARKSMLAIFSLVGERSDLADEYRQRLARTLY
jgi:thioredoxin-like negative regulator of GroEL